MALFRWILLTGLLPLAYLQGENPGNSNECSDSPRQARISARHIEANGVGYNQGYTTLEGFIVFPDLAGESWYPFLDLRGHLFNDGRPAINSGIGTRYFLNNWVLGANLYYDYRKTKRHQYNQVALGLECLGKIFDFRLNGYLPIGNIRSPYYRNEFGGFKGNQLLVSRSFQVAMQGANAEIGAHFDVLKHVPLYFAAGPYYLEGKGKIAWGGQARCTLDVYDYIRFEGNGSYDSVFKWIGQGQIGVNIPLGPSIKTNDHSKHRSKDQCQIASRIYQRVDRNEIIPVTTQKKRQTAIDPSTGLPYFFVFVNNTSHSNGTYESPYPTLLEAQTNSSPGNVIYVFPGDGTTAGMDTGIVLQASQKFFGSGAPHSLATTYGIISIPPQSSSAPQISYPGNVCVSLSTDNQVSGFVFPVSSPPITRAISGINPGNASISLCSIFSAEQPIFSDYTGGTGSFSLDQVQVFDSIDEGFIAFTENGANVSFSINQCIFRNGADRSIDIESLDNSVVDVKLTNNTIQNNLGQLLLFSQSNAASTSSYLLENNLIENNSSNGLAIGMTGDAPVHVILTQNRFLNNTDSCGVFFSGSGINTLIALENTWEHTVNGFGLSIGSSQGQCSATLDRNTYMGNFGAGLFIQITDSSLSLEVTNSTISGNNEQGIALEYEVHPTVPFRGVISQNTITGNGREGLAVSVTGSGISTSNILEISSNTVTSNFETGVSLNYSQTSASGSFETTMDNNTVAYHSSSGVSFVIQPSNSAYSTPVTISSNTVSYNIDYGLHLNQGTGNSFAAFVNDNTFYRNLNQNSLPDLEFTVDVGGTICLEMTGNSSSTGYRFNNPSGTLNRAPCDFSAVNTGTVSENGAVTDVTSCPGASPCP